MRHLYTGKAKSWVNNVFKDEEEDRLNQSVLVAKGTLTFQKKKLI